MRKNIFKYALTLTLMLSMLICGSLVAFAAGEVTVQVDSVTVSSGETVTAEMTIDGAFAAFQGRFVFDTDALKLEDIEVSDTMSANMTMFNQDDITDEFVDGTFASAGANDISVDGPVFTLTFRGLDGADGSTYEISIEQFKIFDAAGEALTVNTAGNVVEEETLVPNGEGTNHMDSTSSQGSPIASEVLDKLENNQSGSAATGSQGAQTGDDNDNTGSQAAANDDPSQEDESENAGSEGSGVAAWVIILIIVVLVAGGAMLVLTLRSKNNEFEEGGSEKAEEAGEESEDKDGEDESGDEE